MSETLTSDEGPTPGGVSPRSLRRRFATFLTVYVVVAIVGLAVLRDPAKYEVFPFSAWPLFCITPADGPVYRLDVWEDDRWVDLQRADFWQRLTSGTNQAGRIEAYAVIQSMGQAADSGDRKKATRMLRHLQDGLISGYQPGEPIAVRLVRVGIDPVTYHRRGDVLWLTPMVEFTLPADELPAFVRKPDLAEDAP